MTIVVGRHLDLTGGGVDSPSLIEIHTFPFPHFSHISHYFPFVALENNDNRDLKQQDSWKTQDMERLMEDSGYGKTQE